MTIETIATHPARYAARQVAQCVLVPLLSGGFLWLVFIYGNALRDPRYLDGWVLAGGMMLQVLFHVSIKAARLSPKAVTRWRKLHIFIGYVLVTVFLSHTDFALPDTSFEWALWIGFVMVTLSGIFGTYLAWSLKAKLRIADGVTFERIPALRAELARNVRAIVDETDSSAAQISLPGLPHDAWIADLYASHLHDFFQASRNFTAHFIGSQHSLKRLIDEIDKLSRYVDEQSQERLAAIKNMVVEKDRLDVARVYFSLTRAWLLVHVPVTYGLVVLTVAHVVVSYAFSSGAW